MSKQTKGERVARKWVRDNAHAGPEYPLRVSEGYEVISALVRAVREDAINTLRNNCTAEEGETCEECDRQAAAIRKGGGR